MSWKIRYLPEAGEDLQALDKGFQTEIVKVLRRVSGNPEYPNGYGKPLRNQAGNNLDGLYKVKFKKAGIRAIYTLVQEGGEMVVIVIAARTDEAVYKEAAKRRAKHDL